ncbi:MAG TPA: glycerol kinase GlpK [Bacteroidales bacterium]|nr:glycerol kinase GlpK [Bacteroidales bacterium]HPB25491.1 glycerol kinase GlpK [Bacteroidales bacterium]HPI30172.1 glycerol kinase GlpK [Bacteroidales bacterium]HQN15884.1 glycerol kinase GlpK [Bacteroidales bacterium]HQP15728.1 glycerol kinase GlpK [Bacteroidales bacterium]
MEKNNKYILSLDQGTTSSRAVLIDEHAVVVGIEQQETAQKYPQPGWVEQDADEIWENQLSVACSVLKKCNVSATQIAAIGITNQRETTVVWDKNTGKAVFNPIIWQDKRTSEYCKQLRSEGWAEYISENTGLVIDSYFSATKLHWILNNVPGAKEKAEQGILLFGTIDTYLIWKLSGGKMHITDYSNASRTMLFNIRQLCWDKKLCALFGIPDSMLPQVVDSSGVHGHTQASLFDGAEIPIAGIAGDQQAALFGQTCFEEGMIKNTYGTGCFLLMNTGGKPVQSHNGLLTTIAWSIDRQVEYAIEGSVFMAGALIKWLRDNLQMLGSAAESEDFALQALDNGGVYFVPAFSGLGAPYWDMDAKGIITGLTLSSEKKHLIRAALESLAFQTRDVVNAMQLDSGISLKVMNVDGGASSNNFLMQFQANILGVPVIRPFNIESTAMGAAFLAGLAVGLWTREELKLLRKPDKCFAPTMDASERSLLYDAWQKAVAQARNRN